MRVSALAMIAASVSRRVRVLRELFVQQDEVKYIKPERRGRYFDSKIIAL